MQASTKGKPVSPLDHACSRVGVRHASGRTIVIGGVEVSKLDTGLIFELLREVIAPVQAGLKRRQRTGPAIARGGLLDLARNASNWPGRPPASTASPTPNAATGGSSEGRRALGWTWPAGRVGRAGSGSCPTLKPGEHVRRVAARRRGRRSGRDHRPLGSAPLGLSWIVESWRGGGVVAWPMVWSQRRAQPLRCLRRRMTPAGWISCHWIPCACVHALTR